MRSRAVTWIVFGLLVLLAGLAAVVYWTVGRGLQPLLLPSSPLRTPEGAESSALPLDAAAGLKVRVFAHNLAGPRVTLFDGRGTMLVSEPQEGAVIALRDTDGDGISDARHILLRRLRLPHGLAFRPDVSPPQLYVAETDKIVRYRYDPRALAATDPRKVVDLPGGGGHHTRTIRFGPDGRLYITVGSSGNVLVEKDKRRAAMLVADADGGGTRVFARGLRNTVFFIFDPAGRIWGNDMGRDMLGDDIPPDELNIVREGGDYGWPYCYGNRVPDPFGGTKEMCARTEAPVFGYQAHSAPLGLAFIDRPGWPKDWQGDLIVAFHGSWNRSAPTGYKLVRLDVEGTKVRAQHDLVTGWLSGGRVSGRPVDVVFGPDDALYVSDDRAGMIYRVGPPGQS